jgi:hypothetical protein
MADSRQHPTPPPGVPAAVAARPPAPLAPRALLITLAIMVGSALLGIVGGLLWSAIAPQALFMVASKGVAYVVNPETSAFIAADGYFSFIAVGGGALIGLVAFLVGVRRFGPLPAAGALIGATAAAFLADWAGSHVGLDAFRHRLGQPAQLGAHGALAFWPLAAGVVVGGIELILTMRERQRHQLAAAEPAGPYPPAGSYPPAAQHPAPGQAGPDQRRFADGHGADGHGADGFASQGFGRDGYGHSGQPADGQQFADGHSLDGHPLDGRPQPSQPFDGQPFDGRQPGWRPSGPAPDPSDSEPGWEQADPGRNPAGS